ncbi:SDR family NAD(P)-dependent oxidoreductase [Altericroceibacterium endophyticum]|uniref:SDR family NAD(P)-dependent oxidoreductase n=1 Tax=Altericroceibacterium endophyticum TaxID=1808508 RepID=A0A6I4T9E2_9SPHN|nr:SDR family NAD(P)-dependent oxidoreductase [Altericroceibacterium endophyticum]MXO66771.1 SDR family NAD(P)-dependent oxidoreductase [Altericroceibacterium endophyticum]
MAISFHNRVAVITGAGNGLGRAYALELARRGAKLVVNDLGGDLQGTGTSNAAAAVVQEICDAGGEAMACDASVTDTDAMHAMAQDAVERWGRIDVLINSAGILRDRTFAKMPAEDFDCVLETHLMGSANATRAVWPHMREQNYGRILFTSSTSGLFGNFGQANYGAAKMGLIGLARTLQLEGAKYRIRINALAPLAATRMTEDILPEDSFAKFAPEKVVPAALYLVSDDAPNGAIIGAGAGAFHSAWIAMNQPVVLDDDAMSVEGFAEKWDSIAQREPLCFPESGPEQSALILKALKQHSE